MWAECIDLVLNSYPIFVEKARLEPLHLTSQNMPTTFSKPILDLSTFDNQHHRSTSDPWYMVRAVQPCTPRTFLLAHCNSFRQLHYLTALIVASNDEIQVYIKTNSLQSLAT